LKFKADYLNVIVTFKYSQYEFIQALITKHTFNVQIVLDVKDPL